MRILALGYGSGSDIRVLRRMADVTGGRAFQGVTDEQVDGLLASALADL